jgi:hypothetical protein
MNSGPWSKRTSSCTSKHVSNGPTEGLNTLAKCIKRVALGFRSFRNYRVHTLLYARQPDWSGLASPPLR